MGWCLFFFFKVHLVSNRRCPHQVKTKDSSGTICCCVRSNVWRKWKRDKKRQSWLACYDESWTFREYGDLDPWYQSLDLQCGANTYISLKGRQVWTDLTNYPGSNNSHRPFWGAHPSHNLQLQAFYRTIKVWRAPEYLVCQVIEKDDIVDFLCIILNLVISYTFNQFILFCHHTLL